LNESTTSFEIALDGPSLDNPLLFERHAARIEAWLRQSHPAASGYRVTTSKETKPGERRWDVCLYRGWLSGTRVILRPLRETPHRARIEVDWDSRLAHALLVLFGVAGVPLGLLILLAGVIGLGRILFPLLIVGVLAMVWIFFAAVVSQIVARGVAAVAGNEFDRARRGQITDGLKGVPLRTRLETPGHGS